MQELLDVFYEECAGAIWEHDGLLNKTRRRRGDGDLQLADHPLGPREPSGGGGARHPAPLLGAGEQPWRPWASIWPR